MVSKETSFAAHTAAVNLLNISGLVFYFQGLAVIVTYFATQKVSWFWQTVFLVMIVTQLFLFVAVAGLIDFWADFRAKMTKRPTDLENELFKKFIFEI